jgi:hypothetical protein
MTASPFTPRRLKDRIAKLEALGAPPEVIRPICCITVDPKDGETVGSVLLRDHADREDLAELLELARNDRPPVRRGPVRLIARMIVDPPARAA